MFLELDIYMAEISSNDNMKSSIIKKSNESAYILFIAF